MKKNHWLWVVFVVLVFFGVTWSAGGQVLAASQELPVFINGVRLNLDAPPIIQEGRTLVPMRHFFEALGADVTWDAVNRIAVGTRDGIEVRIPIASKKPTVDGKTVSIDVPAQIIKGRTYIPLRFVGEALGDQVGWNAAARRIDISTGGVIVANRLPAGFSELKDPEGGNGRVLVVNKPRSVETIRALVETMALLSGYFDNAPQLMAALEDSANKSIQGSFVATMEKKAVKGVAFAHPGDKDIAMYFIYDYADALPSSYARLAALIKPQAKSAVLNPRDLNWRDVRFADGSGSVRLPDGWTLGDSLKGMAVANGPNGAHASFGIWAPVNDLTSPLRDMPGSDKLLWAPYAPPHEAIFSVSAEMQRKNYVLPNQTLKLIEHSPIPSDGQSQSAYLHFTSESPEKGKVRYLASVSTFRTDPWTWVYLYSQIGAPDPEFERQFAVMMEIWNSYQISGQLVRERLDAATQNLKEIGEISQAMYQDRERAQAKAHNNWVEYIRDETLMLDTRYDVVSSQSLHYVNNLADALNQQEGYRRYVPLPLREYYNR